MFSWLLQQFSCDTAVSVVSLAATPCFSQDLLLMMTLGFFCSGVPATRRSCLPAVAHRMKYWQILLNPKLLWSGLLKLAKRCNVARSNFVV